MAYDLLRNRDKHSKDDTAIIRVEQLYPRPVDQIKDLLKNKYKKAKRLIWAQEEPENMAYWSFVDSTFEMDFDEVVSRKPSGSPATGSPSQHKFQQAYIVRKALDLAPDAEVKL